MVADSGPIGGDMSHEFIILADTGESEVFCHKDWLSVDAVPASVDYDGDLQPIVDACLARYAATGDTRSEERRVGKECVCTCSSRWSPNHYKKNNDIKKPH